jgi:hypothetical protein
MPTDPGPFEAFYASALQHPWLLWAAAIAGLGLCVARPDLSPRLRRYCAALTALSLADAWLTSDHVYGIGALTGQAARFVPLFFVLAGDCRYFLLLGAGTPNGDFAPSARAFASAAGLTTAVPIFSQVVLWALPESLASARMLFLVYELAFAALVVVLLARHSRVRRTPWLARVSRFVLLYYGLWATADVIILATGSDLGFALRVVPNVLYYGGLIGAIGRMAPAPSGSA